MGWFACGGVEKKTLYVSISLVCVYERLRMRGSPFILRRPVYISVFVFIYGSVRVCVCFLFLFVFCIVMTKYGQTKKFFKKEMGRNEET